MAYTKIETIEDEQNIGSYYNYGSIVVFKSQKSKDASSTAAFESANGMKPEKEYRLDIVKRKPGYIVNPRLANGGYFVDDGTYMDRFTQLVADCKSLARGKAMNRAIDQKVGLGEAILELQKTAASIAGIVDLVAKSLVNIKKGNLKGLARVLYGYGVNLHINPSGRRYLTVPRTSAAERKNLSFKRGRGTTAEHDEVSQVQIPISDRWEQKGPMDRFLEARFGLAPLLNDAEVYLATLTQGQQEGSNYKGLGVPLHKRMWFRCSSGDPVVKTGALRRAVGSSPLNFDLTVRARASATARQHLKCTDATAQMNKQLGLADPVTLLYELTYASWLVDYFSNVGDTLKSLTAYRGTAFLQGSVTSKLEVVHNYTFTGPSYCVCVPQQYSAITIQREPVDSPLKPGLVFNGPSDLSDLQMATALSFLGTQFIGASRNKPFF